MVYERCILKVPHVCVRLWTSTSIKLKWGRGGKSPVLKFGERFDLSIMEVALRVIFVRIAKVTYFMFFVALHYVRCQNGSVHFT